VNHTRLLVRGSPTRVSTLGQQSYKGWLHRISKNIISTSAAVIKELLYNWKQEFLRFFPSLNGDDQYNWKYPSDDSHWNGTESWAVNMKYTS